LQHTAIGLANFGGYAVDIYGTRAAVAMNENSSVYIFHRSGSTWSEEAEIDIPYPYFGGASCSIRPSKLLIGKPQDESSLDGKVYYYERSGSTWSEMATLSNPSPYLNYPFGTGGLFGASVSVVQDYAIIGSPRAENYKGAIFVYKLISGNWMLQQELIPNESIQFDKFGSAVGLTASQDYLVVGSPGTPGLNESSAAYVYELVNNKFLEIAALLPSDDEDNSNFGVDVGITNNALIIGSELFGPDDEGKIYFLALCTIYTELFLKCLV